MVMVGKTEKIVKLVSGSLLKSSSTLVFYIQKIK